MNQQLSLKVKLLAMSNILPVKHLLQQAKCRDRVEHYTVCVWIDVCIYRAAGCYCSRVCYFANFGLMTSKALTEPNLVQQHTTSSQAELSWAKSSESRSNEKVAADGAAISLLLSSLFFFFYSDLIFKSNSFPTIKISAFYFKLVPSFFVFAWRSKTTQRL